MFINNKMFFLMAVFFISTALKAHDVLVEGKAAYFLSTNDRFRDIYDNGGGIYGGEVTFQIGDNWYGFASVDFFSKKGASIGLNTPTKVNIVDLAFGLKYMIPLWRGDLYLGLGALPVLIRTKDCSPFVIPKIFEGGFGGIAKAGFYFNLPRNFLIDIFFNYSFVKIDGMCCSTPVVQSHKAYLNGCWFGAGLGYRFN